MIGPVRPSLIRSRSALASAALIGIAFACSLPREASANPGITGYSGKPYNGMSATCTTNCHAASNPQPTLAITAPATVQAGSTTEVTLVVNGTRARTSMNAAFTDGTKTVAGTNTARPLGDLEPTEIGAKDPPPNGASGTYTFSFIAPNKNGPITMWVAGMSTNLNSNTSGDGVAVTTRTITVSGADAGTPPTDAGTSSSGNGVDGGSDASTSSGSSGGTKPADGGSSSGDPGSSSGGASSSGEGGGEASDSGCSTTAGGGRAGSDTDTTAAFASLLVAASLLLAKRRTRR